jgi:hypothetical protein
MLVGFLGLPAPARGKNGNINVALFLFCYRSAKPLYNE